MDLLKEFLETSTIHGLAYISTAPSKLTKAFWLLVVIFGFSTAFYLINDSYTNWEASPIATSISTHPISELDFPTITVCPPEGSNTALNYDLVRAQNITLTEKDRDSLLTRTTQILIDKPSEEFVRVARSLLSEENILDIFESTPTSIYPMANNHFNYNTPSYEIWTSKLNGSYKTPWFGENYPCNQTIVEVHFVLELPLVVQDKADDIIFEIQVNVRDNNEWNSQYREGPRYVSDYSVTTGEMSWQSAEDFCVEKGGHLASVKNIWDRKEINARGSDNLKYWIGGTDRKLEDVWVWLDGTPLADKKCGEIDSEKGNFSEMCHEWARTNPKGGEMENCLSLRKGQFESNDCSQPHHFVCQFDPIPIGANFSKTLKLGNPRVPTIELWLTKNSTSTKEACDTSGKLPGFSFTWNTKLSKGTGNSKSFDVYKIAKEMFGSKTNYKVYQIKQYLDFAARRLRFGFVRSAKQHNMTNVEIWDMVRMWKRVALQKKMFLCESNYVKPDFFSAIFSGLQRQLPSDRAKVPHRETKDDLFLSFDIFSYMTFCQHETFELQIFFENLMRTRDTQSILLGVMNTMKMDYKEEGIGKAQQHIFHELTNLLDLKLSQILTSMYNSKEKISNDKDYDINQLKNVSQLSTRDMLMAASMSNHPVSIFDKKEQMQPSALIPFCSFGSKMTGINVPNMTFPLCDIFKPTVYNGRQCYQTDIKQIFGQEAVKGKENGIMLLIDVNTERSFSTQNSNKIKSVEMSKVYLGEGQISNKNMASIHIGTLAPHFEEGPGDYVLTSLKQMTGTENFLGWPQEKRKCSLKKYETCQMEGFRDKIFKCGCSPFQLISAAGQNKQICQPSGLKCFQENNSPPCDLACQGLYADVTKKSTTVESKQSDWEKYAMMTREYERYKDRFGLNLHYSSAAGPAKNFTAKKKVQLQVVHIFFETSTFDRVEKDVKVTLVGQLGLIGGTMGLFTGFSILSGIEILYFTVKIFFGKVYNKNPRGNRASHIDR